MATQRVAAVVAALAVEMILIATVVLSSIGVSPAYRPTPGGPGMPAPAASH